jgi:L1 cell adhesion molecule like protein
MIEILEAMSKKYVPVVPVTEVDEKTQKEVAVDRLHSILFGGDQLTRKRAESAKESRKNSLNPLAQLKGLIPICEDWHAKQIFLEVVWKEFYETKSLSDKGTLYQLRNAVDRRDISTRASGKYNCCDDFFNLVVSCHVIAAAMQFFSMKDTNYIPVHHLLTSDLWLEDHDKRRVIIQAVKKDLMQLLVSTSISLLQ